MRELFNPSVRHTALLEHFLVSNNVSSNISQLNDLQSDLRSDLQNTQNTIEEHEKSSINSKSDSKKFDNNDDIIWDLHAVNTTYLAAIDSTTNNRIDLKKILPINQAQENSREKLLENSLNQDGYHVNQGNGGNKQQRGKLTILSNYTAICVEFEKNEKNNIDDVSASTISNNIFKLREGKLVAVGVKITSNKKIVKNKRNNKNEKGNDSDGGERLISPKNGGEIILCAGVFESPRILFSSGLGGHSLSNQSANLMGNKISSRLNDSENNESHLTNNTGHPSDLSKDQCSETDHRTPSKTENKSENKLNSSQLFLPIKLNGIGCNLQDHAIIPIMCLGKWWSLNNQNNLDNHKKILQEMNILHENSESDKNKNTSGDNEKDEKNCCVSYSTNKPEHLYPFNSVHGYVNLDEDGNFLKSDSNVPPRYVHITCLCGHSSCLLRSSLFLL